MSDSNEASIPMDKLARVYRKMQTRIQTLTATYETEVEVMKAQQEAVKTALSWLIDCPYCEADDTGKLGRVHIIHLTDAPPHECARPDSEYSCYNDIATPV